LAASALAAPGARRRIADADASHAVVALRAASLVAHAIAVVAGAARLAGAARGAVGARVTDGPRVATRLGRSTIRRVAAAAGVGFPQVVEAEKACAPYDERREKQEDWHEDQRLASHGNRCAILA